MRINKSTIIATVIATTITFSVLVNIFVFLPHRDASQDLFSYAATLAWGFLPIEFAVLSFIIVSRQPENKIGWLLMLPAIGVGGDSIKNFVNSLIAAPLNPSPGFTLALWFTGWSWLLLIFPTFLILLWFPTGQYLSKRWRWADRYILGMGLISFLLIAFGERLAPPNEMWMVRNPIGFIPPSWQQRLFGLVFSVGLISSALLALGSIIARYKVSSATEREQIKWVFYAFGVFTGAYILTILYNLNREVWDIGPGWSALLIVISLMGLPAAIAVAILRYHLWDIDVIIRKTLIYSILTVVVLITYFGSVILMQQAFDAVTGIERSSIAVILSTLVIAALFTPLRRNIQEFIDRRFYRQRYDSKRILEQFATSIRDEVEIEKLSAHLISVVRETMQPKSVSLWQFPVEGTQKQEFYK